MACGEALTDGLCEKGVRGENVTEMSSVQAQLQALTNTPEEAQPSSLLLICYPFPAFLPSLKSFFIALLHSLTSFSPSLFCQLYQRLLKALAVRYLLTVYTLCSFSQHSSRQLSCLAGRGPCDIACCWRVILGLVTCSLACFECGPLVTLFQTGMSSSPRGEVSKASQRERERLVDKQQPGCPDQPCSVSADHTTIQLV